MKLAIMQPYFFPYLGYFSIIKCTDKFVFLDEVQYIRHGWIERNRILKKDGFIYIQVPIHKHSRETLIKDILIRNDNWKRKILDQIVFYKSMAKNYWSVRKLLERIFSESFNSITEQNAFIIKEICNYLGIDFQFEISSKLNIPYEGIEEPDDWALQISLFLNAEEYYNPIGGMKLFNKKKYNSNSVKIKFVENKLVPYTQAGNLFTSSLSIIDIMMFNSIEESNHLIDQYITL